jgi:cytochrome P450
MRQCILELDPPDHGRIRNLIVQAFTARRIQAMRKRIQEIIDDVIEGLQIAGGGDLLAAFAALPETVICDILGIPAGERQQLINGAHIAARMLDLVPMTYIELAEQNRNNLEMAAYCRTLFDRRRNHPEDDLISYLVQSDLSNEELIANVLLLLGAGEETTVHLICNGLLALFRHPDQLKLLHQHPTLITDAIQEIARYDAPVQAVMRVALEPVTISGRELKAGQPVICLLGSANRDPMVYFDPDRLDITRLHNTRLMSFGSGIHYCIGTQLARMQAELAISALLHSFPHLELIDIADPPWRPALVFRGLTKLSARW